MTSHVKTRPDAPAGFFQAEARGLRWLAEAQAAGGARVAEVIAVATGRIELEAVAEVRPATAAARAFGRALAVTHGAGAADFGAPPDGWTGPSFIGSREQACRPRDSWGVFYAEQRVRPFADIAVAAGSLAPDEAAVVGRACDAVAAGEFDDDAAPARLHGDLWNGNVLFGADGVVLIDPAAHGGHPETDLAMLALFGCPYLDDVLAAYDAAAPLRPGWEARVPLHQLHPLAVHAAGHGRSYGVALARAAEATLRLLD
ncbi:fructosamine-3-kinase [Frondihabitans sp. PhB188]|uniref:fructosamine kinase family protein n=1 Tax=Frondihabitans sp. PhB188 TaxID=2485200 RepID=UPI000FBE8A83|nr:fructosamine kinase family protein [Frondihabitans sp. PhB188]ROQ41468.1 fructosamine-3-kinase [Frondihabitans sp. PhB188]